MRNRQTALRNGLCTLVLLLGLLIPRSAQAAPTADAYEPDDSVGTARPILPGETQDHDISPSGDVDWVTFELTTYSSIDLAVDRTETGLMYLYLYDATGSVNYATSVGSGGDGLPRIIRTCAANALDPGVYTARVEASGGIEISAYQLIFNTSSCQDAYEPDGDSLTATAIASGETQVHSMLPAMDVDWVTFNLAVPSAVILETDGPHPEADDTYLNILQDNGSGWDYLFGNDDKAPGNGYSRVAVGCDVALTPGTYFAEVHVPYKDRQFDPYQLTFTATPCEDAYEEDDLWPDAKAIASDAPQDHTINPIGDQDWVTFTLPAQTGLKLWTSGPAGHDTRLSLYTDPSGAALAVSEDDGEGAYSLLDYGCSGTLLTPGTYHARVNEAGDDALIPAYQLSLRLTYCADAYEPDNWYDSASTLTSGVPQDHSLDPLGDQDWAVFIVDGPSAITLETDGPDPLLHDTYLQLIDSGIEQIADNNDKAVDNRYSLISISCETPLVAGTYYARVHEVGGDDLLPAYQLTLTVTPCAAIPDAYEPDGDFDNATPITSGLPQTGHSIFPNSDTDMVTFTLDGPAAITLETDGPNPALEDTSLILWNASMDDLAENDNKAAGDLYSRIRYTCETPLPAGTYYAAAYETGHDSAIPAYQISLTIEACNHVYLPFIIKPLSAGTAPEPVGWLEHPAGNIINLIFRYRGY
jgi:methionine-rich copper-binding protein CopC